MAAHRYWRLYCFNGLRDNHFDIKEIELRTSIGGADVTTPTSTVSASSQSAGFEAPKAFDNNTGTTWYTPATNLPAWIKVDFGAGNEKDIVEVALMAWNLTEMVSEFELQWSDDNSSWTTLYKILNYTWSTTAFTSFSASNHPAVASTANKRLWRLRTSAVNGSSVFGLAELEMFEGASAVSACTGGTPYASAVQEATGPVSEAFDGIKSEGTVTGNYWSSHGIVGEWVGYLFPSAIDIAVIGITARFGASINQSPKDFVFEYWDGAAWQTAFSMTNVTGWTSAQTRYFSSAGEVSAPVGGSTSVNRQVFFCT